MIETERLILRPWRDEDRAPLASMHADPEVMHDHPSLLTRAESDAKLDRYAAAFEQNGFGRMAVQRRDGEFLGYVGIMPIYPIQAAILGPGVEIGWRLVRRAWGQGLATEAARAALADGFANHGFAEVLSYTSPSNLRSQAVMVRLGLSREQDRDFSYVNDGVRYEAVVFAAHPSKR